MTSLRGKIQHATRQSDLSRWLFDNQAWVGRELKKAGVPNWDKITLMLNDAGLTDKNGNPYEKNAVRVAFARFFKKFPVLLPSTTQGTPPPEPVKIEHPTSTNDATDYIALSKAIKDKRTIK